MYGGFSSDGAFVDTIELFDLSNRDRDCSRGQYTIQFSLGIDKDASRFDMSFDSFESLANKSTFLITHFRSAAVTKNCIIEHNNVSDAGLRLRGLEMIRTDLRHNLVNYCLEDVSLDALAGLIMVMPASSNEILNDISLLAVRFGAKDTEP